MCNQRKHKNNRKQKLTTKIHPCHDGMMMNLMVTTSNYGFFVQAIIGITLLVLFCAFVLPLILALITSVRQTSSVWQKLRSSLYKGKVWHTRHLPVKHAFSYPLFIFAIDLEEVEDGLFSETMWPLSLIVNFRPKDHLKEHNRQDPDDDSSQPLQDRIHHFVALKTKGRVQTSRSSHHILLVTHLCYFGYNFNPVSFYYVIEKATGEIVVIVAEVSNTPWNEMYSYVLHENSVDLTTIKSLADGTNYVFSKEFHVSPFMEMSYNYDWVFRNFDSTKPSSIHVVTAMKRADKSNALQFSATMNVHRQSMHPLTIAFQIVTYPSYCIILQIWIHYQAFWLFLKGVTFQPHPTGMETTASRVIGAMMAPFFAVRDWFSNAKKTS